MKKVSYLSLLFFIFLTIGLNAQDIIVKVKKGTAKIGADVLTETSRSVTLKSSDIVEVNSSSLVVARRDVIIVELVSGKKYTNAEIDKLLKDKKQSTSGGLATVAFKEPIQRTNPLPLKGSSTRNSNKDFELDFYYPYDNLSAIDNNIQFLIGNSSTQILTNVVLKNTATGKIYYDKIPENRTFSVENLPSGKYVWTYSIEYPKSNRKEQVDFENSFKVPCKKESKKIKENLDKIKKDLLTFSPDMQKLLFLEYCMDNNIYCSLQE
jgi:hypothetical protein